MFCLEENRLGHQWFTCSCALIRCERTQKLLSRKQAEIIVAELEYWHCLALNYWHSFKICSLTDILMLWPCNFGELCPIFCQNTQFCSLAEATCFEDIGFNTRKTNGVSQGRHCCAHAWALGCGTATLQAPTCWSGRAAAGRTYPQRCFGLDFRLYSHWNREKALTLFPSNSELLALVSSLSEGTLYFQRTRQRKRLSPVVLGYSCCCSKPEPQMDPSYARRTLNPSVTELTSNLLISSPYLAQVGKSVWRKEKCHLCDPE